MGAVEPTIGCRTTGVTRELPGRARRRVTSTKPCVSLRWMRQSFVSGRDIDVASRNRRSQPTAGSVNY